MANEGATRTINAYGISEDQIYKSGQWQPVKSKSVSAYGIQENTSSLQQKSQESTQSSLLATKADLQCKIRTSQGTKRTFYQGLLNSVEGTADSTTSGLDKTDSWMIRQVASLKNASSFINEGINGAAQNISGGISGATESILGFQQEALHDIQGWSADFKKTLEPIGLCSAIGDMTDLVKNPLGAPQFLANSLTSLVGKVNPGFVEQMDGAQKTLNLEGLSNLPSKMMGSLRNLATAADAILSVPFEIMSDVYNGLMEILEAIADLIDALVTTVMNLAMAAAKALLDAIIPTDMLIEFFSAVADIASFVGDIAGMVNGFSAVSDIAGQVGDYASLASSALSNPLGAAIQFIPGASDIVNQGLNAVGQVTGALRNPEQFLPPEIGQQMQNISQIPGLGFVGNLGYSVGDTLDSLSDGVFTKALDKFSDKAPMVGQFFNKETTKPAVDTQENYADIFEPPKVGAYERAQGIPQVFQTTKLF